MKRKILFFLLVALLILPGMLPLQANGTQSANKPAIDPQALQMLRQMTDYMSRLNSFKVHAETSRDVIVPSSMSLESNQAFDIAVQRPNRLYIAMQSAAGNKQVFYDGTTFTVYTPSQKFYASVPAPATMNQLFQTLRSKYGLEMPAADLLSPDAYQRLTNGVTSAVYVGESMVNGVMTHQLAFQKADIDWQIWIQSSNAPLPVKLVIRDKSQSGVPQYTAVFSRWDVSPIFYENTFTFMPGVGDRKITIKELPATGVRQTPKSRLLPNR